MTDYAGLQIRVDSDEVSLADKRLKEFRSTVKGVGKDSEKANKPVSDLPNATNPSSNPVGKATKKFELFGKTLGVVALGATALTATLGAGVASLKAFGEIESLETSFISLTGSIEDAKRTVAELTDFTATTPFQLDGVASSARQLITAQGNARGLTEQLRILGDIASVSAVPINELASIYTKGLNKGKIQAEELNQIAERGIPIYQVLAEQFGVAKSEVQDLGSKGKIAFEDLKQAFASMSAEGGIAFGATERQAQTLQGIITTMRDNVKLLASSFGEDLATATGLKGLISEFNAWMSGVREGQKTNKERIDSIKTINEGLDMQSKFIEQLSEKTQALGEISKRNRAGRASLKSEIGDLNQELALIETKLQSFTEEEAKIYALEQANKALNEEILTGTNLRNGENKELVEINKKIDELVEKETKLNSLRRQSTKSKRDAKSVSEQIVKLEEHRITVLSKGDLLSESELKNKKAQIKANEQLIEQEKTKLATAESISDKTIGSLNKIEEALKTSEQKATDLFLSRVDTFDKAQSEIQKLQEKYSNTEIEGNKEKLDELLKEEQRVYNLRLLEQERYLELIASMKKPTEAKKTESTGSSEFGEVDGFMVGDNESELEKIIESHRTEEEAILASYERRREIILSSERLTQEQITALIEAEKAKRDKKLDKIEKETNKAKIEGAFSIAGSLLRIAEEGASRQGAVAQGLFSLQKGLAIASATISIQEAIASGFASGTTWEEKALAVSAIIKGTGSILSTIKGTEIKQYERGGYIPAGHKGIVAEASSGIGGAEFVNGTLVQGDTQVTSSRKTEALLNQGSNSNNKELVVIVNNNTSSQIDVTETNTDTRQEFKIEILQEAQQNAENSFTQSLNTGTGAYSTAISNNYSSLKRG